LCLQQTEVIAAAAAGVAAEGLSPDEAKVQAENAAHLSVALAENAIVILMLVEDHLRSQGQHFCTSRVLSSVLSSASMASSAPSRTTSLDRTGSEHVDAGLSRRSSLSSDAGGLPVDVRTKCRLLYSVVIDMFLIKFILKGLKFEYFYVYLFMHESSCTFMFPSR
jgi:hypothetical protein